MFREELDFLLQYLNVLFPKLTMKGVQLNHFSNSLPHCR